MPDTRIHINEEGRVDFGRRGMKNIIRSSDPGYYNFKLEKWKSSKTNNQIRGFHGPMIDAMCDVTGYHPHEAKFILKDMFGEKEVVENKFTGEVKTRLKSLGDYKKDEMTALISKSLMWMETELGIVVDMEEKKRYALDQLTGELEEIES